MLKKIISIIPILLFYFTEAFSQAPTIEWQKCYGAPLGDQCKSIQPTNDGGSIACGTSLSLGALVIKINNAGSLLWQQNFPGIQANSIQQTTDGGYIIAGYTTIAGHGNDFWVAQLNSIGNIVWQRTFGGSLNDIAYCVRQTTDGGFIVAGQILSSDGDIIGAHGLADGWILKLDNSGNLIWQKSLGGSDFDTVVSIEQTSDGGYIVGGNAVSTNGDVTNTYNSSGAWVIKLGSTGNIMWQRTYGSSIGVESIFSICITNDGNYAFVSGCYENAGDISGFHGGEDLWVVKLNTTGNIIWQKSIGGTLVEVPRSIFATDDGGCIAAGYSSSNDGDVTGSHGATDFLIAKLSSSGLLEWTKLLGGSAHDRPSSVYQTPDNCYIVAGFTGSNNNGDVGMNNGLEDFWVVKLTPEVVPVTLISFDAFANGQDVMCAWKTVQEQNSHHFVVERSDDATYFNKAGIITAAGNSSLLLNYEFIDKNMLSTGKEYLFYRLNTVDIDGSFKYSQTIKVKLKFTQALSVYPNPASDKLTINFTSSVDEKAFVTIYNDAGLKVYEQALLITEGNNTSQVDIRFLAAGTYTLILEGKKKYVERIIKIGL